jgi:hypothetical protein
MTNEGCVPTHPQTLSVYFGDLFLSRAICPELAGETVAFKDIIRARTSHRRHRVHPS